MKIIKSNKFKTHDKQTSLLLKKISKVYRRRFTYVLIITLCVLFINLILILKYIKAFSNNSNQTEKNPNLMVSRVTSIEESELENITIPINSDVGNYIKNDDIDYNYSKYKFWKKIKKEILKKEMWLSELK